MNSKKAFWLKGEQKKITTTLHSIKYNEGGESVILFNLPSCGEIKLNIKAEEGVNFNFIVFILPDFYIEIGENVKIVDEKNNYTIPVGVSDDIKMIKNEENIEIYDKMKLILSFSSPIIKNSVSFGIKTSGSGKCELTIF